jgi:hypothetical protein
MELTFRNQTSLILRSNSTETIYKVSVKWKLCNGFFGFLVNPTMILRSNGDTSKSHFSINLKEIILIEVYEELEKDDTADGN